MDWGHGYFTQTGYSFGYYPETMPVRLHWAALVQGHQARSAGFRYLDAGCGQGYNLIVAALLHPDSEFVGVDFMPRHIAHARQLAERIGLSNVVFVEGDFTALAEDPSALGMFDYIVAHGISTWIAPAIRNDLARFVGRALAPGGIYYNSYNTMPGWLATTPLQHLVLLEQERGGPEAALEAARRTIATIVASAPALAGALPGLKSRLDSIEGQDSSYLLQEYNNLYWGPVFVTEMIERMAGEKLDYLGTASLAEVHPAAVPADLRSLVEGEKSVKIREQLRDYAINQGFRRDLYVKGKLPFFATRQDQLIRAQRFACNPLAARAEEGQPYKIKAGGVELHGAATFYNELLDRMARDPGGCTVGALIDAVEDPAFKAAVVETLCMMVHGGWALPQLADSAPGASLAAGRLAEVVAEGAPYRYLPLPAAGSAIGLNDSDWLVLDLMIKGTPREQMPEALLRALKTLNRVLLKNGETVQSPEEMRAIAQETVDDFAENRWPFLRAQGVEPV
jgi:SAM-dependent methyltransferase